MTSPAGRSAPELLPPVLEAQQVSKRYGDVLALDDVSLAIARGECVALVGESGSGKTTLLRCFNRMVEPDAGRVRVEGRDARELDRIALRRRVGYVQQEGGLLPHWRVLRNAALVPWLQRSEAAAEQAAAALRLVGLPPGQFGSRWPRELSGGQRQRVAIARALAAHPSIVLLDEPFGALDAITRAELQQSFLELRSELRVTTLLVTHDLREALRLGDRIAVLRAGRIEQLADGPMLVSNPGTQYVRRLLERAGVAAP
ncbi:MAG: ATP-binding cassette domain-containing protein [Gemmatimonadetes bacterium]|nr:ATP-binding cassette domain-containing protein [Gemmatimonadota bacterium]